MKKEIANCCSESPFESAKGKETPPFFSDFVFFLFFFFFFFFSSFPLSLCASTPSVKVCHQEQMTTQISKKRKVKFHFLFTFLSIIFVFYLKIFVISYFLYCHYYYWKLVIIFMWSESESNNWEERIEEKKQKSQI